MNRFLLGAAIGAALMYFLDTERGETRRNQFTDWASQYVNGDTMQQARQAGQATMQQAKALTGQVGDQVNQLRSGRKTSTTGTTGTTSTTSTTSGAANNAARTTAGAER